MTLRGLLLIAGLLMAAGAAHAQDVAPERTPDTAAPPETDTISETDTVPETDGDARDDLDYVREVFAYVRHGRTNPVEPPAAILSSSPDLALTIAGVILDRDDASASRAILRAAGSGGEIVRRVVRPGDTFEQYRVAAIRETEVDLVVSRYGGSRRITIGRSPADGTVPTSFGRQN